MIGIFIGVMLANAGGGAARDLFIDARWPLYVKQWLRTGGWDDRLPTSDEWTAFMSWDTEGFWDDNNPTIPPTADMDGPYAIWDDEELTT